MSRYMTAKRRRRSKGRASNKILLAGSVLVSFVVIGALSLVGYIVGIANSAPPLDTIKPEDPGQLSQVFAADGTRLGFIQNDELRQTATSKQIPQVLKNATVSIEDQRFYEHKGVDFEGVIRSAIKNIKAGKTVQGGSTITMQLVRNFYITKERTWQRKIKEAKLAEELEDEHPGRKGKNWILTTYLNVIPYGTTGGQTAIGAQAASRMYFNKSVSKLKLPEAAMIAGLPQAPSEYSPYKFPDKALARRNEVLAKMYQQHYISADQYQSAVQAKLGVKPSRYYADRRESYFFDYVKDELIKKYGAKTVKQGGLKVYTTIDLKKQQAARSAIANVLNEPGDPSSAIVTIDPKTGYIKAMASSSNYGVSKFNLAAQAHRQPGSTFKVFSLMTALARGIDPDKTGYVSKPLHIDDPHYGMIDTKTYDGTYGGYMSITKATLKSDNSVYMQLGLDLGVPDVIKTAHEMGVTSKLDDYPATILGGLTLGVSPLEMANAYSTIADGGYRNRPIAIRAVDFPDGHTEHPFKPKKVKVFDQDVTYKATQILEENVQAGTGTAAQTGCPAGGKTGTTSDFKDAWFAGFTPRETSVVWVGYPQAGIEMLNVHGGVVNGGRFPAQIWGEYMKSIKGSYCGDFKKPKTLFKGTPFFGQYAATGSKDDKSLKIDTDGDGKPDAPADSDYGRAPGATAPTIGEGATSGDKKSGAGKTGSTGGGSGKTGKTGGGGSGKFDPELYESPPQAAPKTSTPTAPTTGGTTPPAATP